MENGKGKLVKVTKNGNGKIVEMDKSGITNRRTPADTAEIRDTAVAGAVGFQLSLLFSDEPPVDIHDVEEIKYRAKEYFFKCQQTANVPTFIQFCSVLGKHPQDVYAFIARHAGHPTTEFLKRVQGATASITLGLSEKKMLDPATSIFALKNSHVGMKDNPTEQFTEEKTTNAERERRALSYKEQLENSTE